MIQPFQDATREDMKAEVEKNIEMVNAFEADYALALEDSDFNRAVLAKMEVLNHLILAQNASFSYEIAGLNEELKKLAPKELTPIERAKMKYPSFGDKTLYPLNRNELIEPFREASHIVVGHSKNRKIHLVFKLLEAARIERLLHSAFLICEGVSESVKGEIEVILIDPLVATGDKYLFKCFSGKNAEADALQYAAKRNSGEVF